MEILRMSDNPYQSPQYSGEYPRAAGVLSGSRDDLRKVAKYQKGLIFSILFYLILVMARFFAPAEAQLAVVLALVAISITATVFVFLLSIKVYGTGKGILLGILTLIPLIGLIVLLTVNGKATATLKQNGIRVGFLGANPSEIS
jgi:hypothetical protein